MREPLASAGATAPLGSPAHAGGGLRCPPWLDYLLVGCCCALLLALMPHMAAADLWPTPDAVEYSLVAQRLATGQPPLLALGLHEYPSRYALAFPLVLVPWVWLLGGELTRLYWGPIAYAIAASLMLVRVGRWVTGSRAAALLAALLWITHPAVLRWSSVVMSEPVLVLGFLLMLELARPWLLREPLRRPTARAAALGLCVAWLTVAKAPHAYWAVALGLVLLARWRRPLAGDVRPAMLRTLAAYVGLGLLVALADAAYRRWAFGAWGGNGYLFWVPQFYSQFSTTFNPRYLLHAADPLAAEGNLKYYAKQALGWMPQFHTRVHAAVLLLALPGLAWGWLGRRRLAADPRRLTVWLLAGWGVIGGLFCLVYFFQSERFPLAYMPLADWLLATGVMRAAQALGRHHRRLGLALGWGAAALLLTLQVPLVRAQWRERVSGVEVSRLAEARTLLREVPPQAWLFSNYELGALQWLRGGTRVVALHGDRSGDLWFNGHAPALARLPVGPPVRTASAVPVDTPRAWREGPPLLFHDGLQWAMPPVELRQAVQPAAWALLLEPAHFPPTREALEREVLPKLRERFAITPVRRAGDLALYRLALLADSTPSAR